MKTTTALLADDIGAGAATDRTGRRAVSLSLRGGELDDPASILLSRNETVRLIGRLSQLVLDQWPEGRGVEGGRGCELGGTEVEIACRVCGVKSGGRSEDDSESGRKLVASLLRRSLKASGWDLAADGSATCPACRREGAGR